MKLELTDIKRYELEREGVVNVLLAAARRGEILNEAGLAKAVGIDIPTVNKLIAKLQTDNIIK